jgi:hypothetical protein
MTLSPPSFDMATVSALNDFKHDHDDDDDGAMTIPSPISKPRPDMDDATPPPSNPRRHEEEEAESTNTTPALTRDTAETQDEPPPHACSFDESNEREATDEATAPPRRPQPQLEEEEEDPEAESIALARMLMEQEAIESYGALSADFLRYNSHQFSREDLAALQAAMAEDEGSDDGEEEPFSYDVMLRLGESIGDVKKERWNLVASSEIAKLEEFKFLAQDAEGKDENDCSVKCLVCQFAYEQEETLKRLPCGHVFHSECVAQWLKDNDICPYCRQTIVDKYE